MYVSILRGHELAFAPTISESYLSHEKEVVDKWIEVSFFGIVITPYDFIPGNVWACAGYHVQESHYRVTHGNDDNEDVTASHKVDASIALQSCPKFSVTIRDRS